MNVERDINKAKSGGADDLIYRTITGLSVNKAGSSTGREKGDAGDSEDADSGDSDEDDEGNVLSTQLLEDIRIFLLFTHK